MAKVTERCFEARGHTCFICDFSPPRSGDPAVRQSADLSADFLSVAYNPGRAVRTNPAMLAAALRQPGGPEVVFTLATRDMNRLALQSLLLGAQLLGLENVVIVQGDPCSDRDLARVRAVNDYRPTEFIASVAGMNRGRDFRDSALAAPTDFCVGATVDLGRGIEEEARLAHRKVAAGAHFLITQPIFDPAEAERFQAAYRRHAGAPLPVPVFYGLAILEPDGVVFSGVPRAVQQKLAAGRSGADLARELFQRFQERGLHNVYLVPPIKRGGARNYVAAQEVLTTVSRR